MGKNLWKFATIIWALTIVTLSLMPASSLSLDYAFAHFDKAAHVFMYALLSIFFILGFHQSQLPSGLVFTLMLCFLLGLLLELLQATDWAGRQFDYHDLAADVWGGILGFSIVLLLSRRNRETP